MRKRFFVILLTLVFCFTSLFFTETAQAAGATTFSTIIPDDGINRGIAVASDGSIYTLYGEGSNGKSNKLIRYNASGALVQEVSYPNLYAKELTSSPDGSVIVGCGYGSVDLYIYAPGRSSVTTIEGNRNGGIQAITFDAAGNFYALSSYKIDGIKYLKLQKLNASKVSTLKTATRVTWDAEYDVSYTAPGDTYYVRGIAVDAIGNIYIADQGSSNGYDGFVNGIIRYNLTTKKATPMFFTNDPAYKLVWVHGVTVDATGNVYVISRNSGILAHFAPGATVATSLMSIRGYPEDVAVGVDGSVYVASDTSGVQKATGSIIKATGLTLSSSSCALVKGGKKQLTATVTPSNATSRAVMYVSSNEAVATVSNTGLVTAKAKGTATITAATWGGAVTKTCKVTVTDKNTSVKKPAAPVISKAVSSGYNSIKVTWKSVSKATSYIIYRATSKSGKYTQIGTSTTTSYTNKKLTTGKTYYYKVKAKNSAGSSGYSAIKSAKPTLAKTTIKLSKKSSKSIVVSWKKVSGASGYEIYRSTKKSSGYKQVKRITKSSTIKYTNTKLSKKVYYYKIRSYRNVSGKRVYSSWSSVKNLSLK